jgi:isopenicillin N synthase-like dioxygenase
MKPTNIPVIDMSQPDDMVSVELNAALTTTGFATLIHHGISKSLRERAFGASKGFFSLPAEEKQKCAYQGHQSNRGYIGIGKEFHESAMSPDFKETYDLNVDESSEFSQPWPTPTGLLQTFQQDLVEYFDAMDKLHLAIMRLIAMGLGLPEDYLVEHCNERHENLRLLHYPEIEVNEKTDNDTPRPRGAIHTDYGTITLLMQDEVGGLRVKCRDDTWVNVHPVSDAVVVNVGDMLQRWTNGILVANEHQVVEVSTSGTTIPERYSIAFFCNANKGTTIECLEVCVSDDRPAQYDKVNAHDYLTMRLAQTIEHA